MDCSVKYQWRLQWVISLLRAKTDIWIIVHAWFLFAYVLFFHSVISHFSGWDCCWERWFSTWGWDHSQESADGRGEQIKITYFKFLWALSAGRDVSSQRFCEPQAWYLYQTWYVHIMCVLATFYIRRWRWRGRWRWSSSTTRMPADISRMFFKETSGHFQLFLLHENQMFLGDLGTFKVVFFCDCL